jgi:hypothetical protein
MHIYIDMNLIHENFQEKIGSYVTFTKKLELA